VTICEAADAAMKAGSGVIDIGGESKVPNPVKEGLSLEMLCDLDDRPVCTARSGGAILNSTGM
jgi:dihydropteroate synthase